MNFLNLNVLGVQEYENKTCMKQKLFVEKLSMRKILCSTKVHTFAVRIAASDADCSHCGLRTRRFGSESQI